MNVYYCPSLKKGVYSSVYSMMKMNLRFYPEEEELWLLILRWRRVGVERVRC